MNILKKIRAKQADLFAPPVAIAFLGDSVTQGCFEVYLTSEGAVQTVFEPESGYAADVRKLFALLYPGVPVQFINAGISGDNAPSGLQRLERDVLAYHPDLTVVCFGLNDACRGDETQEEYASALDGIFTKLKEAGSEIIFMTPNMMNTRLSEKLTVPEIRAVAEDTLKIQLDGRLERYLDAAREVCTRQGAAVCDCYAKWKLLSQNGVDTTALLANGINHPSREMAWMFAYSLLETMMVDLEALVPEDHLLRKIERVMDYEWLYALLSPYYCHDNGRPGIDPVVLIKMVLIQHLFGIASLRQTYREIQVNVAYRWFLGYGLLEQIPHFATVSYAFCKRFPDEVISEIFEHILNKALNNRMVDPSMVFIDGTHIKASANKKKFQKEQVRKAAKIYSGELRREVNAEREKLGKKPIEDDDNNNPQNPGGGETAEKTVSTTDPDCGMFVKGEHERQFAYEAHTVCDKSWFVLGVEVTAGNVHDSVAWDAVYDEVTRKFNEVKFVTMDAGYKTPWIAKKTLEDGSVPVLPYTRYTGRQDRYKPWEYTYDPANDTYTCPRGGILRHTTTDRDGKRTYRSTPEQCRS